MVKLLSCHVILTILMSTLNRNSKSFGNVTWLNFITIDYRFDCVGVCIFRYTLPMRGWITLSLSTTMDQEELQLCKTIT